MLNKGTTGTKQGNYWYKCFNVTGSTLSFMGDWTVDLPNSMPVLLSLGYRGSNENKYIQICTNQITYHYKQHITLIWLPTNLFIRFLINEFFFS